MKCVPHAIEYCQTCYNNQLQQPFTASFEGFTANPEDVEQWPNTVTVGVVEHYAAAFEGEITEAEEVYADSGAGRQLVEVDTNYKPTRPGQHPVRLTRADAVKLAAAVLEATEDTFHFGRYGKLRPAEAADLLKALRAIDFQLGSLREHAEYDLFDGIGLTDEPAAVEPTPADEVIPKIPVTEESFTGAILALFPTIAVAITGSDACGALSFTVQRRCQETGETPLQVLGSLSTDDRTFALIAHDPAAFLASRIES